MLFDRLVLLVSIGLLAGCDAQSPAGCDLGDPAGLSRCIRRLLTDARPKVEEKADPLKLPNHEDGDLKASNIVIRGIAGYNIRELSVTFPQSQRVAVRATITWPRLRGNLHAKLEKCKKILWRRRCFRLRARPVVTVAETVGSLATTLNVQVTPGGQLTVTATGTNVSINLAKIKIKANVRGLLGFLNKIFLDPASKISTRLANKWWRKNKSTIENKAKDALNKVVRDELTVHLGRLLKL